MKAYNAAVCFVDILGFSFLTKGQIKDITVMDYQAWGIDEKVTHPYSYLAATILVEFRDALLTVKKQFPDIHIAQFSDCSFLWCNDVIELLKGVHRLMWLMVEEKAILCRGGLSYGEVVTVEDADNELGAFIVGDAVSRAAKNESRLKGPRITMDEEFPQAIWDCKDRAEHINWISSDLFHCIESEINMEIVDEYRWYLCESDYIKNQQYPPSYEQLKDMTKRRLKIANVLKYHPKMGWNTRGKEGMTHLEAGIQAISKNRLLGVKHSFECSIVLDDKRSIKNVERMNAIVETDECFKSL